MESILVRIARTLHTIEEAGVNDPAREEVLSLLNTLVSAGYELVAVDTGEDEEYEPPASGALGVAAAAEDILSVDEATLHVRNLETGRRGWIFLVLGNGPGELPADYTMSLEPVIAPWSDAQERGAEHRRAGQQHAEQQRAEPRVLQF